MNTNLKLYVWEDVLCGDLTSGIMFALAGSADEARELIIKGYNLQPFDELRMEPRCIEAPEAFIVFGADA